MYYDKPKLAFKKVPGCLALEYAMEHYPGCWTPTGLNNEILLPIFEWCDENNCGEPSPIIYQINFKTEEEMTFFLLKWT
jgi:hypothetical protein